MLKRSIITVLVASLILSSADVSGASASPSTLPAVILTHIQAGVAGGATKELIMFMNQSTESLDVTDWCLQNKSSIRFVCLSAPPDTRLILPPFATVVAVSSTHEHAVLNRMPSVVYTPTSASSGSLVGSNDIVSLMNAAGEVIDRHSWSVSAPTGMFLQRSTNQDESGVMRYVDTDSLIDWVLTPLSGLVIATDGLEELPVVPDIPDEPDVPDVPDPVDPVDPVDPTDPIDPIPTTPTSPVLPIRLSELLPNVAGADDGFEYIELFNPNDVDVLLDDYSLVIGTTSPKTYRLSGFAMTAGGYLVLRQSDISFTLGNANGTVKLVNAEVTQDATTYTDAPDDAAWSVINGIWQFTRIQTPGSLNQASPEGDNTPVTPTVSEPKPCAVGWYRSPETNRCRKIVVASVPKPCQPGWYRSPDTNRCRKNVAATSPTPCKEGQERNPDTNRCRTVKKMTIADYGVLGATEAQQPDQWYVWWAVGALVGGLLVYAGWEWRHDLARLLRRIRPKSPQK